MVGYDISKNEDQTILTLKNDTELLLFVPKDDYDKLKAENAALWDVFHAAQDVIDCLPQDVEMDDGDQELLDEAAKRHRKALLKLKNLEAGK